MNKLIAFFFILFLPFAAMSQDTVVITSNGQWIAIVQKDSTAKVYLKLPDKMIYEFSFAPVTPKKPTPYQMRRLNEMIREHTENLFEKTARNRKPIKPN